MYVSVWYWPMLSDWILFPFRHWWICASSGLMRFSITGNLPHLFPIRLIKAATWSKNIHTVKDGSTYSHTHCFVIHNSGSPTRRNLQWQERVQLLPWRLYPTLLLVHYPPDTKRQWTGGRSIRSIAPSHIDPYQTLFNCIGSTIDPGFSAAVNILLSVLPSWSIALF